MSEFSYSRFGKFLFLAGSLASQACGGSQSSARGVQAPSAWRPSEQDAAAPRDGGTETASMLDRASFVRAVLRENPTIEAAKQAYRGAAARIRQSGTFEDPMIDVGIAPLSIASSSAPFGWQVGVSQRLPWFGKRALERSVASFEAEAAKSDIEATRRELALTAALLFDQYFLSYRSEEINAEHVRLMTALRAGALAQFEAGRGSSQDPLQAEAELDQLERDAVMLASEREVAVAQMNELLHRDPEKSLPPPPKELPLPAAADAGVKPEASLVERRPEVASALLHARAEGARAERAERDGFPDFTVSASYNSMWEMPEHRFMVGVGFNLPIQSGRRGGAADEANASRGRYEAEAAREASRVRTDIVVAKKELTRALTIVRHFEERALPVARRQIEAARNGFVTSQNSFMAVVEAERNLRRVELEYQMARAESDRRRLELDRALGLIPGVGASEVPR